MIRKDLDTPPKPFIKWVGGKRQLIPEIHARLPKMIKHYFEPFVGGGALLWTLEKEAIESITINDYNTDLVNLYNTVKFNPNDLITDLNRHINEENYFYATRNLDREPSFSSLSNVQKASRFIYLNKTGFNGLYRVNSKGQNNVPFGRYANPKIADEPNIMACSQFLADVNILNGDFEGIKPFLTKNSFVYFDPPYAPLSATSSFTGYTDQGFGDDMQLRLKQFCDYIHEIGGQFMLSNSSVPIIYDLYKDYRIHEVLANRAVNCKASGRGKIKEVLIRNYD
jgi:DNA adenine methylase